jgi:hypothetical protein
MASTIKVDQIEGSSGSTITVPTGQTLTVTDGIPVASGGTGLASFTAGDILYATGATTLVKLAKGTGRQGLQTNSGATAPEWTDSPQSLMTAAGDILYASGANTLAKLAKGSDDDVLTLASGVPSWAASAAGGKVGQVQYTQITDTESTTSTSYVAIPTLEVAITPSAATSKILIQGYLAVGFGNSAHCLFQLFRDTTQIALGDAAGSRGRDLFGCRSDGAAQSYSAWPMAFSWLDSPSSTSALTYSFKWRVNTATVYLGRPYDDTDNSNYNRSPCQIAATEILV